MVKLNSFFQKLLLGETLVEKFNSPINGEIKVYDGWFGKSMRIGGIGQSDFLVEKLWKTSLSEILNTKYLPCRQAGLIHNTLILGLGCGNAAKLISQKWPGARITGIEIDPKVVETGKKYFGLGEIKNLEIVVGDAIKIVQSSKFKVQSLVKSSKFDLILVDTYRGKEYPNKAEGKEFIGGVRNLLSQDGIAIFNRLSFGEYQKPAAEFAEKLRQYFPKVWTKEAVTNLLIFCQ